MIFTITVKHFLVAITKAGICCLNKIIIRYTANCPKEFRIEKTAMSKQNCGQFIIKLYTYNILPLSNK